MIFLGGFDMKIHVYSFKTDFEYHTSLTGHSNSIRDFAFSDFEGEKLLASCS
jgi:WD40 repeat protein